MTSCRAAYARESAHNRATASMVMMPSSPPQPQVAAEREVSEDGSEIAVERSGVRPAVVGAHPPSLTPSGKAH